MICKEVALFDCLAFVIVAGICALMDVKIRKESLKW